MPNLENQTTIHPKIMRAQERVKQAAETLLRETNQDNARTMANLQSAQGKLRLDNAEKALNAATKNLKVVEKQVAKGGQQRAAEIVAEHPAEQSSEILPQKTIEEANAQNEPGGPYSMEDLLENACTFDSSSRPQKIHRFRDLFAFEESDENEAEIAFEQSDKNEAEIAFEQSAEIENYQLVGGEEKAESYELVDPVTAVPTPAGFAYGRGVLFFSSVILISVIVKNFFFKPKKTVVDRK